MVVGRLGLGVRRVKIPELVISSWIIVALLLAGLAATRIQFLETLWEGFLVATAAIAGIILVLLLVGMVIVLFLIGIGVVG